MSKGMTISYGLLLLIVMTIGIITLSALSPVVRNQVFAGSSNDNDEDSEESENDNNDGGGSDSDGSTDDSLSSAGSSPPFDATTWDPSGVIVPVNEITSTYENKEHGFAFEFPADWQRTIPYGGYSVILEPTDPASDIKFEVSVIPTERYLDPKTMEVKNRTVAEYGVGEVLTLQSMENTPGNSIGLSNTISKTNVTSIAGKNDSWRIEYVTSVLGLQQSFNVEGIVLGDSGKLYKLHFSSGASREDNKIFQVRLNGNYLLC